MKAGRKPHKGLENLKNQAMKLAPEPPEGFTREEAKRFYTYAQELVERAILFPSDVWELEALVMFETQAKNLLAEMASQGAVTDDKNGDERRNPRLMALANIRSQIADIRKLLALGPIYRNKLPGAEAGEAEEIGDVLHDTLVKAYNQGREAEVYRTGEQFGLTQERLKKWLAEELFAIR